MTSHPSGNDPWTSGTAGAHPVFPSDIPWNEMYQGTVYPVIEESGASLIVSRRTGAQQQVQHQQRVPADPTQCAEHYHSQHYAHQNMRNRASGSSSYSGIPLPKSFAPFCSQDYNQQKHHQQPQQQRQGMMHHGGGDCGYSSSATSQTVRCSKNAVCSSSGSARGEYSPTPALCPTGYDVPAVMASPYMMSPGPCDSTFTASGMGGGATRAWGAGSPMPEEGVALHGWSPNLSLAPQNEAHGNHPPPPHYGSAFQQAWAGAGVSGSHRHGKRGIGFKHTDGSTEGPDERPPMQQRAHGPAIHKTSAGEYSAHQGTKNHVRSNRLGNRKGTTGGGHQQQQFNPALANGDQGYATQKDGLSKVGKHGCIALDKAITPVGGGTSFAGGTAQDLGKNKSFLERFRDVDIMAQQTDKTIVVEILENCAAAHKKNVFLFQRLKACILRNMRQYDAPDLSNICHSFVVLGFLHEDFVNAMSPRVVATAHLCSAAQLTRLLDAYASLRLPSEEPFRVITEQTLLRLEEFSISDIMTHASSFARLNIHHQRLFTMIAERLVALEAEEESSFIVGPKNGADTVVESYPTPTVLSCHEVEESGTKMSPLYLDQHVEHGPWTQPKVFTKPEGNCGSFQRRECRSGKTASPKNSAPGSCSGSGSPAVGNNKPVDRGEAAIPSVSAVAGGSTDVGVKMPLNSPKFSARDLTLAAYAFAKLGFHFPVVFDFVSRHAKRVIRDFTAHQIQMVAVAFQRAGVRDLSLFHEMSIQAQRRMAQFNAESVALLLRSYSLFDIHDEALFTRVVTQLPRLILTFRPLDVATTLNAFARLSVTSPALIDIVVPHVIANQSKFNASDLQSVLHACAKLGATNYDLLRLFASQCNLVHLSPSQLTLAVTDLGKLCYRNKAFYCRLQTVLLSKLEQFSTSMIAQIYATFIFLELDLDPTFDPFFNRLSLHLKSVWEHYGAALRDYALNRRGVGSGRTAQSSGLSGTSSLAPLMPLSGIAAAMLCMAEVFSFLVKELQEYREVDFEGGIEGTPGLRHRSRPSRTNPVSFVELLVRLVLVHPTGARYVEANEKFLKACFSNSGFVVRSTAVETGRGTAGNRRHQHMGVIGGTAAAGVAPSISLPSEVYDSLKFLRGILDTLGKGEDLSAGVCSSKIQQIRFLLGWVGYTPRISAGCPSGNVSGFVEMETTSRLSQMAQLLRDDFGVTLARVISAPNSLPAGGGKDVLHTEQYEEGKMIKNGVPERKTERDSGGGRNNSALDSSTRSLASEAVKSPSIKSEGMDNYGARVSPANATSGDGSGLGLAASTATTASSIGLRSYLDESHTLTLASYPEMCLDFLDDCPLPYHSFLVVSKAEFQGLIKRRNASQSALRGALYRCAMRSPCFLLEGSGCFSFGLDTSRWGNSDFVQACAWDERYLTHSAAFDAMSSASSSASHDDDRGHFLLAYPSRRRRCHSDSVLYFRCVFHGSWEESEICDDNTEGGVVATHNSTPINKSSNAMLPLQCAPSGCRVQNVCDSLRLGDCVVMEEEEEVCRLRHAVAADAEFSAMRQRYKSEAAESVCTMEKGSQQQPKGPDLSIILWGGPLHYYVESDAHASGYKELDSSEKVMNATPQGVLNVSGDENIDEEDPNAVRQALQEAVRLYNIQESRQTLAAKLQLEVVRTFFRGQGMVHLVPHYVWTCLRTARARSEFLALLVLSENEAELVFDTALSQELTGAKEQ